MCNIRVHVYVQSSEAFTLQIEDQTLFAAQCYWSGHVIETVIDSDASIGNLISIDLRFQTIDEWFKFFEKPEITIQALRRYQHEVVSHWKYGEPEYYSTEIGLWNSTLFELEFTQAMINSGAWVRVNNATTEEELETGGYDDTVGLQILGTPNQIAMALMWIYHHDTAH